MKTWREQSFDALRGVWEESPEASPKKAWLNSIFRELMYLKKDNRDARAENEKLRQRERDLEDYIHQLHADLIELNKGRK